MQYAMETKHKLMTRAIPLKNQITKYNHVKLLRKHNTNHCFV
jgi:hypothetical protein